uniref:Uncharacterized protein n=1 Tax=Lygus hesperus TaxID=30085 RepID=A0A146M3D5_LYGHE
MIFVVDYQDKILSSIHWVIYFKSLPLYSDSARITRIMTDVGAFGSGQGLSLMPSLPMGGGIFGGFPVEERREVLAGRVVDERLRLDGCFGKKHFPLNHTCYYVSFQLLEI